VVVPPYCRSRNGRVYRVLRFSQFVAPDRVRFTLRVQPVASTDGGAELSREIDASFVLDKAAHRQAVPTPETTFDDLWRQLRWDIDVSDG
jgi:hypothetical protein